MDERLSKSFGYLISFVLPGFLGLWAAGYFAHDVRDWLEQAGRQDSSFGSGAAVFLAALGIGIVLSGVRYIVMDVLIFDHAGNWIFAKWGRTRPEPTKASSAASTHEPPAEPFWRKVKRLEFIWMPAKVPDQYDAHRREPDVHALYVDLRERFHSFAQFYGNTFLALLISFSGWVWSGAQTRPPISKVWMWVGFLAVELFLLANAHQSFRAFRTKKKALLDRVDQEGR
jgi:hypothetical protein